MQSIEEVKAYIEKQVERPDWTKLKEIAKQKMADPSMSGLITPPGALLIAARQMYPNMDTTKTVSQSGNYKARVIQSLDARSVKTKTQDTFLKEIIVVLPDLGVHTISAWGKKQIDALALKDGTSLKYNEIIELQNMSKGQARGEPVIRVNDDSKIIRVTDSKAVKPVEELLKEINLDKVPRSAVGKITGIVTDAKVINYKACSIPGCGKAVELVDNKHRCKEHGIVSTPLDKKRVKFCFSAGDYIFTNNDAVVIWEDHLHEIPQLYDKIEMICIVRDYNWDNREKAKKSMEDIQTLMANFPRTLRIRLFSYKVSRTPLSSPISGEQQGEGSADDFGEEEVSLGDI